LNVTMPVLVDIADGTFLMGTSDSQLQVLIQQHADARSWERNGRFQRERPDHPILVQRFSLAQLPVTISHYRCFLMDDGYNDARWWTSDGWTWRQAEHRSTPAGWNKQDCVDTDQLPVVGVSWYEASAYCAWLSAQTGESIRLPSEAEWEYAARGVDGRIYPWGDIFSHERCNIRSTGIGRALDVGQYSPLGDSPFGVADMIGNVSEWTSSLFRPYPYAHWDGREDLNDAHERVTRGGSWSSPDLRARAASRGMNDPWFCDDDLGFRIAAS